MNAVVNVRFWKLLTRVLPVNAPVLASETIKY